MHRHTRCRLTANSIARLRILSPPESFGVGRARVPQWLAQSSLAMTLNMLSEGYNPIRNFAVNWRVGWVPRGITLKNSWMVPTRGINDRPMMINIHDQRFEFAKQ